MVLVAVTFASFGSVHGFSVVCIPQSRQLALSSPSVEAARRAFLDVSGERNIAPPSLLLAKKGTIESDEEDEGTGDNALMSMFQRSPGTIVVLPFVLIFGLDLVANIAVVTKRSLEVFFTGEYTVWTPWQ